MVIRDDNLTAVSYITNVGGSNCELVYLARHIWLWCLGPNMFLPASHIAGVDNFHADFLPRQYSSGFYKVCRAFVCPILTFSPTNLILSWICVISCNSSDVVAYEQTLPMWYSSPGELKLANHTVWHGNSGEFGVVNGKLIQGTHLNRTSFFIQFHHISGASRTVSWIHIYVIQDIGHLRSWFYTEQCTYFLDIERIL